MPLLQVPTGRFYNVVAASHRRKLSSLVPIHRSVDRVSPQKLHHFMSPWLARRTAIRPGKSGVLTVGPGRYNERLHEMNHRRTTDESTDPSGFSSFSVDTRAADDIVPLAEYLSTQGSHNLDVLSI